MSQSSLWNRWDFHLHSPCSILNNQFGDPNDPAIWEKYVALIEEKCAEKGIVALGITDYFTIEGYKKLKEFQIAGRLKGILLFPNIEFRIDKVIYRGVAKKEPRRLNLHVIFSPDISIRDIEERFLHDLDFTRANEPFDAAKTEKLKIPNLIDFGKQLIAEHPPFKDMSPFEVGCLNAVVRDEDIKKGLDTRFKGQYLLVLAEENLSLLDWDGQDHGIRKQLIQMCHAIFSSNERTKEFALGKTHDSINAYLTEFKSLKPCIWGCDSHGFEERFLEPDDRRYCWIKGEVTWEGLKQILFEPEARVRIQQEIPEMSKSIYSVETVEIKDTIVNSNLKIDGCKINLNPNLVTVIGGRGSGKTAFLDLIASCFYEGEKLNNLENSFYYRLFKMEETTEPNHSIPIELTFKSKEKFQKLIGDDANYFDKTNIIYLTQNHFDEYSSNPSKLNHHIIYLVFEKSPEERKKFYSFESTAIEIEKEIQKHNLEIFQLTNEIHGQKEIELNNLKIKQGDLEDIKNRVIEAEAIQGGSDAAITSATQELENLKLEKRKIEVILYNTNLLESEIRDFMQAYNQKIQLINGLVAQIGNKKLRNYPEQIQDFKVIEEIITHNNLEIRRLDEINQTEISERNKRISVLEGNSRVIADLQQKIFEINLEIEEINEQLRSIEQKEKRIQSLDSKRFELYSEILQTMMIARAYLQERIVLFEAGKDDMLKGLKTEAYLDFGGYTNYIKNLIEKLDNRTMSEEDLIDRLSEFREELNELMNGDSNEPDFTSLISKLTEVAKDIKLKPSTTLADYYDSILHRFVKIGLRVEFNNRELNEMSMGERAIVLLKILLALDDKPLLIDQPEEHLDNRYIYNELTPAIRSAKTKRQIIIATHNANLVVNTDSEQIIIACNDDGTIKYQVGALEDKNIRESIKTILEGGDEAFKKREEKYGYIY